MYLGWSCMSCRQPTTANAASDNASAPNVRRGLIRHLPHMIRTHILQEFARVRRVVLLVIALDAEVELVARDLLEVHDVEQRVVRLWQSVQREHSDYRRQRRREDGALVRGNNEPRPRRKWASADVQRILQRRNPILERKTAQHAKQSAGQHDHRQPAAMEADRL